MNSLLLNEDDLAMVQLPSTITILYIWSLRRTDLSNGGRGCANWLKSVLSRTSCRPIDLVFCYNELLSIYECTCVIPPTVRLLIMCAAWRWFGIVKRASMYFVMWLWISNNCSHLFRSKVNQNKKECKWSSEEDEDEDHFWTSFRWENCKYLTLDKLTNH